MSIVSAVPLSNDDEAVIQRSLPLAGDRSRTAEDQIDHVYEILRTKDIISAKGYHKVALQFPDELLIDAAAVVARLKADNSANVAFYVLGDTSYGSCCVDEVAAEHVLADVVVHYGRSCLSPVSKLPVIYIFGRLPLDVERLVGKVSDTFADHTETLLIVSDTTYLSSQQSIVQALQQSGHVNVVATSLATDSAGKDSPRTDVQKSLVGRTYDLPQGLTLNSMNLIYVGPPSPSLTTVLMTHAVLVKAIYSYNPLTEDFTRETSQNAALKRRYATVQKARDASVIGIVVGTLGVNQYLDLIKHLRSMISKAGKKSYLFAMGKLNPSKMANFGEIDAFVLVACGENSLIDSRDFYKPVVTPFELSLALKAGVQEAVSWTGDWITDFAQVLSLPQSSDDDLASVDDDEAPHFSLVTGQYHSSRPMYTSLETATESDFAIAKRSEDTTIGMVGGLFSPAAQHLSQRQHWAGLGTDHTNDTDEQRDAKFAELTSGRSGVARGYS